MKKLVILLSFIVFFASCDSIRLFPVKVKESSKVNIESVPPAIVEAFHKKYSGIIADEWYKVKNDKYAVQFKKGTTTAYAFYTSYGVFRDERVDDQDYYDPYDDYDQFDYDPIE